MTSYFEELIQLTKAKKSGKWRQGHCPVHSDQKPSFVFLEKPNGEIAFKCMAGCTSREIFNALNSKGLILNKEKN